MLRCVPEGTHSCWGEKSWPRHAPAAFLRSCVIVICNGSAKVGVFLVCGTHTHGVLGVCEKAVTICAHKSGVWHGSLGVLSLGAVAFWACFLRPLPLDSKIAVGTYDFWLSSTSANALRLRKVRAKNRRLWNALTMYHVCTSFPINVRQLLGEVLTFCAPIHVYERHLP